MKNAINYYYNLYPDKIYKTKKEYYFFIYNVRYSLVKYEEDLKDIKKIYDIQRSILSQKRYIHPLILNIEAKPITFINNIPYILLKTINYGEKINLNSIISFSSRANKQEIINWKEKWSIKNDYLEFQIRELGKKYKIIKESFSYYIGLAETAIAILNVVDNSNIDIYYTHKRVKNSHTTYDLYNPLNITEDTKVRDAAEYLKSNFFEKKDIKKDLYYYLNTQALTKEEMILFLARMMYPTYYFDIYEEIITGKKEEVKINKIIKKAEEYEKMIRELYQYCKNKTKKIQIEWLE